MDRRPSLDRRPSQSGGLFGQETLSAGLSGHEDLPFRRPLWTRSPFSQDAFLDRRSSQSGSFSGQEALSVKRPLDRNPSQSGQEAPL